MEIENTPAHLCTTFQRLHDAGACAGGYAKLAKHIRDNFAVVPKEFGMRRPIPVAMVLESNGVGDAYWVLRNATCGETTDAQNFMRMIGCEFADRVLHIFEAKRPGDNRVRECIRVTRAYVAGEATSEELVIARRAAYAAAADAAYAAAAADAADAAYAADAAAHHTEKQWQLNAFRAALAGAVSTFSKDTAEEGAA